MNQLRIYRGTTTLNTTNTINIQPDTWYNLEMVVDSHNVTGNIEIWLDGVRSLTYNGDTIVRSSEMASPASRVGFKMPTSTVDHLTIDNFYVMDGSGNENNGPVYTWRIETIVPNSDVTSDWTPSTGNDLYATINEEAQNANYISDTTSGNKAMFDLTNVTANAGDHNIGGVMITCDSKQTSRFKKYPKFISQNGSGGSVQDSGVFVPGADSNPGTFRTATQAHSLRSWKLILMEMRSMTARSTISVLEWRCHNGFALV
jgi:hypothetical protein